MSEVIACDPETDVVADVRETYHGPATVSVAYNGINGLVELWIDQPDTLTALVNVQIAPEEVVALRMALQEAYRLSFTDEGDE